MPRSVSALRRDGSGTLAFSHPVKTLLPESSLSTSCLRSDIQRPLTIPSQRRDRARHHSRNACEALR
jgi:hypothetical protein